LDGTPVWCIVLVCALVHEGNVVGKIQKKIYANDVIKLQLVAIQTERGKI
jgi:translation initiation factor IF-1